MPFCKKDCGQCFSLCPERGASFGYLKKVGGGKISLDPNQRAELPYHIPVLPDRLTERLHISDIVGVHGGNLLTSNGENVVKGYRVRGLAGALNLKNEVKGVLQFYVPDRKLEGIWDNRKKLYSELNEFDWQAIIAPNYSIYEDAPRMDHLYNMKRSSTVYNELLDAGLPAIPDISWYNQIDLDQWIREINRNKIKSIAFSFQVVDTQLKASNIWKHYMLGFQYLTEKIDNNIEIVIIGIVSSKRVEMLKRICRNKLKIINQTAYVQSRRGVLSEMGAAAPVELSKNEILLKNIDYYNKEYFKINENGGEEHAKIQGKQHDCEPKQ